jgi:hypothetical protein
MTTTATIPQYSKAVESLLAASVIPPDTTKFELILESEKVCRIKIERWASEEELETIAQALIDNPDEFEVDQVLSPHYANNGTLTLNWPRLPETV